MCEKDAQSHASWSNAYLQKCQRRRIDPASARNLVLIPSVWAARSGGQYIIVTAPQEEGIFSAHGETHVKRCTVQLCVQLLPVVLA